MKIFKFYKLYYIKILGDYTIIQHKIKTKKIKIKKTINLNNLLNNSYTRAKIIGIIFIIIGAILLINPTNLNIKIGFIFIFLGLIMIFIITEKSIPKKISDSLVEVNIDTVNKIIKELNLQGNAVFLPKSEFLTEERIFIPPNKSGVLKIPEIKDDNIILIAQGGKTLGISVPPSGLKLLNEIEKDNAFKNITIENLEEKLKLFVGMNLLKSISFKKIKNDGWHLEIENLKPDDNYSKLYHQYPGPTSSAIITMITRILNQKIRIYNTTYDRKKIKYNLNLIKKKR
ncbi:MAG: hypothetical protein MUO82_11815 [Candidatus Thermoplasmatota archaeon]|nr:hypothetical protein [Candidatus Thermoplasmatota archaeon]